MPEWRIFQQKMKHLKHHQDSNDRGLILCLYMNTATKSYFYDTSWPHLNYLLFSCVGFLLECCLLFYYQEEA